ncbi:DMT family transporter [Propionivibrio sp.]|uniref:DMT family transporter n=1 Tax=Propionivibrio sp. TaxID=2212460 RepID=UPI0025D13F87|nr:DMT family transporter [Propionivibrio sp.]MBK7356173.1 DMT family transporter [Propionivibrio sp.]
MQLRQHHAAHGVILFLTAIFLFAALDATAKYLTAFFAVPLLVWARYFVHLVVMLATIAPGMGREIVVTKRPWLMTFRGLMLVGVTLLVQLAFRTLPLAETTAIVFVTPLLVALLAGPMLGEKMHLNGWLATLAGFGGVLLIARPGGAMAGIGVIYCLGGALCYALYQILTRKLLASEPPMRLLFYTALVGTLSMSFFCRPTGVAKCLPLRQTLLIASLGFYGGIGHFLLIRAFREAPASTLSPLLYVQLIWAMLLGWLVFGQLPDMPAITGMLIIGASGLSLVMRRTPVLIPAMHTEGALEDRAASK